MTALARRTYRTLQNTPSLDAMREPNGAYRMPRRRAFYRAAAGHRSPVRLQAQTLAHAVVPSGRRGVLGNSAWRSPILKPRTDAVSLGLLLP
ncbi:MAG: hypothetical protein ABIR92_05710 [Gemmatimonadaceae bacterium]